MRKNPLTMTLRIELPEPKAEKDISKFLDRLVAKMEGTLRAKVVYNPVTDEDEETFTLSYYLMRKIKAKLAGAHDATFLYEISYEGASALARELKGYPTRPREGVLEQILYQLTEGLKEKKQHDRDRKRTAKRDNRPTVRESRGI